MPTPTLTLLAAALAGLAADPGPPQAGVLAQEPGNVELEVVGSAVVRHDPLVRFAPEEPRLQRGFFPARLSPGDSTVRRTPRLVEVGGDEQPVEAQIDLRRGEIVWRLPGELAPDEVRRYRLSWAEGDAATSRDPERVPQRLEAGGRPIAVYVAGDAPALPPLPEGVDPLYRRDGYLHPLWTPSGHVVTGDYPASHRHQHGVMFAWTRTRFEGREIDFWNTAANQGFVASRDPISGGEGPVFSWLFTPLEHMERSPRQPVLGETWMLSAYAAPRWNVLDLESNQFGAQDEELVEVLEYHYGGLAFRGPEAWEGADGVRVLTSEGGDRAAADGQRVRWVALYGVVAEEPVTVAVLSHRANFRAPQPVRVHPENPYFCFAPCRLGAFEILGMTEALVSRYRFVLADGELDAETIESLWQDYAHPLVARVAR